MDLPPLKPYALLGAVAWMCGFGAYVVACAVIYHQTIAVSELIGVGQLSVMVFAAAYVFVYFPILLWLRRSVRASVHIWLLPLVAVPLGFVAMVLIWLGIGFPALLLGFMRSDEFLSSRFFATPEAVLFYWMFGIAGLVIGCGFVLIASHKKSS